MMNLWVASLEVIRVALKKLTNWSASTAEGSCFFEIWVWLAHFRHLLDFDEESVKKINEKLRIVFLHKI